MWYVIYTKPKSEERVSEQLRRINLEVFNPKLRREKIVPLFPCYIFVKVNSLKYYRLLKYTRGVKRILGNGETPYIVPQEVIDIIKLKEKNGYVEVEPRLKKGDSIILKGGPFKNFLGIFEEELSDKERVKILLGTISDIHIVIGKNLVEKAL